MANLFIRNTSSLHLDGQYKIWDLHWVPRQWGTFASKATTISLPIEVDVLIVYAGVEFGFVTIHGP